MSKFSFALIFSALLMTGTQKSYGSHAVGADLSYICLGGNSYRFFFTLYRDCAGIAVSTNYTIQGTSVCGASVAITVYLDSTYEVAHVCSTVVTNCVNSNSPYMGVQANYYHGDVTLPYLCDYWTFGLSPALCNRNAAINNLSPNGSTYCMYVEATLNNTAVQCNNSPVFESLPVQFLSPYQIQYYNGFAYDIDGDSITYQLYTPHSDAVSDVQYITGLSGTQPVTYIPPDSTRFNAQTGEIRIVADGPQITVIAIRVDEYRNGVLIGSVERDIELIFEIVANNLPQASGFNGSNNHLTSVCADSALSFFISTTDIDGLDQTTLTWNAGIPGATFVTSGTQRDTGYFYWHPGVQDISTQPHIFTVTVSDDACPVPGVNSYSYLIFVDSCFAVTSIPESGNDIQLFSASYSLSGHSVHIQYKLNEASEADISLYDMTGRKINTVSMQKLPEANIEMNVQGIAKGIYILGLKAENGESQSVKVLID